MDGLLLHLSSVNAFECHSILAQAVDAAATATSNAVTSGLPDATTSGAEQATGALAGPWGEWITQYGAWFIFVAFIVCGVGLHVSEDFLLIPAGALIYHESLLWSEVLPAAYFGLVIGDSLWILVCRTFGTRLVHSRKFLRMMGPRRLLEAKYAMEDRGVIVLILARFIPGTRTPVLTMTGILHMAWWKFLTVELVTVAITAPIQISIGWVGAYGVEQANARAKDFGSVVTIGLAVAALSVAAFLGYRWWKQAKARKGPRPRSPVSWLRHFGRVPARAQTVAKPTAARDASV